MYQSWFSKHILLSIVFKIITETRSKGMSSVNPCLLKWFLIYFPSVPGHCFSWRIIERSLETSFTFLAEFGLKSHNLATLKIKISYFTSCEKSPFPFRAWLYWIHVCHEEFLCIIHWFSVCCSYFLKWNIILSIPVRQLLDKIQYTVFRNKFLEL